MVVQSPGHLDSDVSLTSVEHGSRRTDQQVRYMQEVVRWHHEEGLHDLDLEELQELSEELAASNALMPSRSEEKDVGAIDVMEIFSPPRYTEAARRHRFRPGLAIDLSTCRPSDGANWDLLRPEDQDELFRIMKAEEPLLLTGSPRCDPFSHS